jgi:hypothetical protein
LRTLSKMFFTESVIILNLSSREFILRSKLNE